MYKFLGGLQNCLDTGMRELYNRENGITNFDDLEVRVWKQTWGDTTLGFGGIGGQAITDAYTVVVMDKYWSECVVFHGMRYAYRTRVTDKIAEGIQKQQLVGASEFENDIK